MVECTSLAPSTLLVLTVSFTFLNVSQLLLFLCSCRTAIHRTSAMIISIVRDLKPVLNWANVCSPNILQTVQRTMIHFLIELLVHRTWFRQFNKLYFVLNWLVMRCKLRPELAADAQQTA